MSTIMVNCSTSGIFDVGDLVDMGDGQTWVATEVDGHTIKIRRLGWPGKLWRVLKRRAKARWAKFWERPPGGFVPRKEPPKDEPVDNHVVAARARVALSLVRFNLGVRIYDSGQPGWYALYCMTQTCRETYGYAPVLHAGHCWKCKPEDWAANREPI